MDLTLMKGLLVTNLGRVPCNKQGKKQENCHHFVFECYPKRLTRDYIAYASLIIKQEGLCAFPVYSQNAIQTCRYLNFLQYKRYVLVASDTFVSQKSSESLSPIQFAQSLQDRTFNCFNYTDGSGRFIYLIEFPLKSKFLEQLNNVQIIKFIW